MTQLINSLHTPSYSRTKSITYFGNNTTLTVHYFNGVNADGDRETEIVFATSDETFDPKAELTVIIDTRQMDNVTGVKNNVKNSLTTFEYAHARDVPGKDRQYTNFLNDIHLLKPCLYSLNLESGAYTNEPHVQRCIRTDPLSTKTIIIP